MTTENLDFPPMLTEAVHLSSGKRYVVTAHLNANTTRPDEFPKTVAYRSLETGEEWCRPLDVFVTKFRMTDRKLSVSELSELVWKRDLTA